MLNPNSQKWWLVLILGPVYAVIYYVVFRASIRMFDLKTPGVSIRPLINMADGHAFNEVFFEDVRVPEYKILGEIGQGGDLTKEWFVEERVMIGARTWS